MYVFKILPYFLVLVGAFDPSEEIIPSCNDSVKGDKDSNGISNNCINASINKDGWLYAECDVGSKTMSFGVGLNYCISNNGGNIAIQDDGMAMDSQGCKDGCKVTIKRGKYAKMTCTSDSCKGEIDLDKAIIFNGSYLKCGKHIGSGGVEKRDMRVGDL